MVPYLDSLPIYTPILLSRPMTCFGKYKASAKVCFFLLTASMWVSIRENIGTRLLHPFMVMMTSFTWMACATTVIVPVTTLVNVLYLIVVGPAHSPSSWVINFIRPPQLRNIWSILIGNFSNIVPLLVLSWNFLSYQTLIIATPIQICVSLQILGI